MKRLVLILISCVAGCAPFRAVNPHPTGTPEYVQWQDGPSLREARRRFMFEGHESGVIVKERSPSSIFSGQHWDWEQPVGSAPRIILTSPNPR
ncbi:MAG: hypothetical protein M1376_01810 [Planctomycetes bacterium]|nr:hypothetical protein [Planctomycetota bacterium]